MHYKTIATISQLIAAREFTSVEVTEHLMRRISEFDPVLGAYSYVDEELAYSSARALDQELASGRWRGPLHGVPIAVKDIYGIKGAPYEIGMPSRRGMHADVTATVVHRLIEAGAVILGKLHTTEGVYGEHTRPFIPPKNPWDHAAWVGVSSSGSGSATAAGLAFGTLGSDTGGSIRMPSSANGVTGLKPTWGRCSRYGVFELAATLDHVGPMARSARDAGIILEAIAGYDANDPTSITYPSESFGEKQSSDLSGRKIGVDYRWALSDVSDATSQSFSRAIETFRNLGAEVVPIDFPSPEIVNDDWFKVCGVQTALAHGQWFDEHSSEYGAGLREVIELGKSMSGKDYQEVLLRRLKFKGSAEYALTGVDAMLIPGLPYEAPPAADMMEMDVTRLAEVHRYTVPFTMSQLPTITMPSGFSTTGLPVSIQLVGKPLSEKLLIKLGAAFQAVTEYHQCHPTLMLE